MDFFNNLLDARRTFRATQIDALAAWRASITINGVQAQ